MSLSQRAQSFWAKSSDDGHGHPLIAHLLDVAAVSAELLGREPARTSHLYASDLGLPLEQALPWVCALVGLHDLGKASPAFQLTSDKRVKWRAGAERLEESGLLWRSKRLDPVPHGVVSQKLLGRVLESYGWARKAAKHAADAVGAHHGFRATGDELKRIGTVELGDEIWDEARAELVEALLKAAGVSKGAPTCERLGGAAFMRLAGLTSFADWIGSNPDFFGYERGVGDPAAYYQRSLGKARRALETIGWEAREPLRPALITFSDVFPFAPRPLQRVLEGKVEGLSEPTLLIVEAPMGEGKTEAAFFAHLRLQAQSGHRGMYVALPTQATGNAMFERTKQFLGEQGHASPPDLQLLHGSAILEESYANMRVKNVGGSGEAVVAREWFTAKKRALLSEYGVGTVDQALLSVLNVKHQFIRLWGLGNRVVVIDEVHAYDTYTSHLIETLIRWLHALGSSVILMSATLPKARREALLEAYGAKDIPDIPYPRLLKVSGAEVSAETFETRALPTLTLKKTAQEVATLADLLFQETAEGGCAACILNTVQRAQEVYCELRLRFDGDLILFHARFPAEERQKLEQEVLRRFGKDSAHRPKKAILVATQVVEQSLDVDFDVMVSDLAPVDLILQRSGRLHRHEGKHATRPKSLKTPKLYVAGLEHSGDLPDLSTHHFDYVYDPYILLKTWLALREKRTITLPDDFEPLIEVVYSDIELANLSSTISEALEAAREVSTREIAEHKTAAKSVIIGQPETLTKNNPPGHQVSEDDENPELHPTLRAQTRLGEKSLSVIPLFLKDEQFHITPEGNSVTLLDKAPTWDEAKRLYLRNVKLSRKGVVHELSEQPVPEGWEKHPLLRNCRPLILENGQTQIGNTVVSLEPDLGVVYRKVDDL